MKIGKTTFSVQMPQHLILAAERGYNAIPGAMAYDITSWGDFKKIIRELKTPEVKEVYSSLVFDTIDIFAEMCQKYICSQLGIENIGDGGWSTNGWSRYKREFEETFRGLAQAGYAIVFISHDKEKTIKPQNSGEYQQIGSSLQSSALSIIENMSDIIAYAHMTTTATGERKRVLTLRSPDESVRVGCRFARIVPEIDFTYEALVKAMNDAIDAEAKETGGKFITNERQVMAEAPEYDYDALMAEFQTLASELMNTPEASTNMAKIQEIIAKYLGKNKKISDTTREQAELVSLVVDEIKATMMA